MLALVAALVVGIAIGMPIGSFLLAWSLVQDADGPDRPHRTIAGKYYYVVPETEYVMMEIKARGVKI